MTSYYNNFLVVGKGQGDTLWLKQILEITSVSISGLILGNSKAFIISAITKSKKLMQKVSVVKVKKSGKKLNFLIKPNPILHDL